MRNGNSEIRERCRISNIVRMTYLFMCIYIDPDTGKVIEVDFGFTTMEVFVDIPIHVYREIELELKKNIWFRLKAEGRRLNYLVRMWEQKIGDIIDVNIPPPSTIQ